jgi:hypothetical protein
MPMPDAEHWKMESDDHDYPAAEAYLRLVLAPATAQALAEQLRSAPLVQHKARICCGPAACPCCWWTTCMWRRI